MKICLSYLVGQFPAINHGYLLSEVRHLRDEGIELQIVSISAPDRSSELLSKDEREEASRTYYIKSAGLAGALTAHASVFFRRPVRYLRGLLYALALSRGKPKNLLFYCFYFAEAVILGRWMERNGLSHVHISFANTVGLITTRIFPVTMSFTVHGFGELHDPVRSHLAAKISAARFVRAISKYGRNQLMLSCEQTGWKKLDYVPLGIDPSRFQPRPFREHPDPVEILCVGRLSPEKGQRILIDAIAMLACENRRVKLRFVGDGPDRVSLEDEVARRGLSDIVSFEGWAGQERLLSFYEKADLFAMASLYEGIPVVLMEAMSMEIPCIAPCITGIPELITNGVDGLLFSPADATQLFGCIAALLDSPELRRRIGEMARRRVLRDYDLAENTRRFAGLLRNRLTASLE